MRVIEVKYLIEAAGFLIWLTVFRVLPLDLASFTAGRLMRFLGPLLRSHGVAKRNMRAALPHLTPSEIRRALGGMWDNLGRVAAEYAHLDAIAEDLERVKIVDDENLLATLKGGNTGGLLLSAHFGNWELSPIPSFRAGIRQSIVYRAPNNPYVDKIIRKLRSSVVKGEMVLKGPSGVRQIVNLVRNRQFIGILTDQKYNEGAAIPFFNMDAMTTTAPAALAHRLGVPILLGRVERTKGARFRIIVSAVDVCNDEDSEIAVTKTTRRINASFESWIRERPDLWLWAHRRWPKEQIARRLFTLGET